MNNTELAKAFVAHYYSTFDRNRLNLINLYQENSMLTFEGRESIGLKEIQEKLSELPQECTHAIDSIDSQPSFGGMLVFVSGKLQLAEQQHSLRFSQMFCLVPTPAGSFYVHNDVFRLNYG